MKFANERAFTDAVVDLALMNGWLVHHDRMKQNVQGTAGFADLVLAKQGTIWFWELKTETGKLTDLQAEWLAVVNGIVLRPSDWDQIVRALARR